MRVEEGGKRGMERGSREPLATLGISEHNEEERGLNSWAAAGGLNPYILAASLAALHTSIR